MAYIPFRPIKNRLSSWLLKPGAAGQGMHGGAPGRAPNSLGVGTRQGLPSRPVSKHDTNILTYPLDVTSDPQQGHHILFHINVIDKARLKKQRAASSAALAKAEKAITKNIGHIENAYLWDTSGKPVPSPSVIRQKAIARYGVKDYKIAVAGTAGKDSTSIQATKPVSRLKTSIALYMPPTISVSYNSNYGDKEIGMMAQLGADALRMFSSGEKGAARDVLDKAGSAVKHMALTMLDTVAPGAKELLAIESGQIIAPRMELMFQGIGRREFSYAFTFIPRSEKEALVIDDIVYVFKLNMASNLVKGTGGKEYTIPNTFDIDYYYHGGENSFLNKISRCVLESMEVSYGGEKYVTYSPVMKASSVGGPGGIGNPPQTTKISLKFKELELITQDKVKEGY